MKDLHIIASFILAFVLGYFFGTRPVVIEEIKTTYDLNTNLTDCLNRGGKYSLEVRPRMDGLGMWKEYEICQVKDIRY